MLSVPNLRNFIFWMLWSSVLNFNLFLVVIDAYLAVSLYADTKYWPGQAVDNVLSVNMSVIMPLLGGPYSPCFLQKLKDVQEFLKLPQMVLSSRQIKIHKGPLSDHIKNWEDVNKTLAATAYESFLHADY